MQVHGHECYMYFLRFVANWVAAGYLNERRCQLAP